MSKVEKKTVDEMMEDMKDVRVKAIMAPEMKKDMLEIAKFIVDNVPKNFVEDHKGSEHMYEGAKGLVTKLEESLETSDLSLSIAEVSFVESLFSLAGIEMPGVSVVDKESGVIIASQKNPENVGMNISEHMGTSTESKTIH
jgi:hypothetical protein